MAELKKPTREDEWLNYDPRCAGCIYCSAENFKCTRPGGRTHPDSWENNPGCREMGSPEECKAWLKHVNDALK